MSKFVSPFFFAPIVTMVVAAPTQKSLMMSPKLETLSLIGMVNMEAAGGMAMMGAMSTSVPMAEATSEANEKRRKQREEAALRKKSLGSRAQEEERLQKERERKIVQSNYLDDFWDDDEDEGASRKIRCVQPFLLERKSRFPSPQCMRQ